MDQHAHDHAAGNASAAKDKPAGHGMVVVGTGTLFMSHLPMFMSPHDYQVIIEGTLSSDGADPQRSYREDRTRHPEATIYTFNPAPFVLTDLFPPAAKRTQFRGDLFRGHFEAPDEFPAPPALLAGGVQVAVTNVVYAQKLTPHLSRPATLEYLLFGKGEELFLAHLISAPPDFDQIVSTKVSGRQLTADELRGGVRVQVNGTTSAPAQRLKAGKAVSASATVSGKKVTLQVEPRAELYFMARELAEGDD